MNLLTSLAMFGTYSCSGNILKLWWTARRSGSGGIGGGGRLRRPLDGTHDQVGWQNGVRFFTDLFRSMQTGKRVSLNILSTWTIRNGEIKSGKKIK